MASNYCMVMLSLQHMYLAYVKNCKFTSPNTLPQINFMQRSLVELFAIDTVVAYQFAFIYIRQLAIHLRNAIATKSQASFLFVYLCRRIATATDFSLISGNTPFRRVLVRSRVVCYCSVCVRV